MSSGSVASHAYVNSQIIIIIIRRPFSGRSNNDDEANMFNFKMCFYSHQTHNKRTGRAAIYAANKPVECRERVATAINVTIDDHNKASASAGDSDSEVSPRLN